MNDNGDAYYSYALLMRPPAPGALPKEGLIHVSYLQGKTASGHYYWGSAEYNRRLTEEELKQYDMEEC